MRGSLRRVVTSRCHESRLDYLVRRRLLRKRDERRAQGPRTTLSRLESRSAHPQWKPHITRMNPPLRPGSRRSSLSHPEILPFQSTLTRVQGRALVTPPFQAPPQSKVPPKKEGAFPTSLMHHASRHVIRLTRSSISNSRSFLFSRFLGRRMMATAGRTYNVRLSPRYPLPAVKLQSVVSEVGDRNVLTSSSLSLQSHAIEDRTTGRDQELRNEALLTQSPPRTPLTRSTPSKPPSP